jgi:hypothetical protein
MKRPQNDPVMAINTVYRLYAFGKKLLNSIVLRVGCIKTIESNSFKSYFETKLKLLKLLNLIVSRAPF